MDTLPPEIIYIILEYVQIIDLIKFRNVNKLWRDITCDMLRKRPISKRQLKISHLKIKIQLTQYYKPFGKECMCSMIVYRDIDDRNMCKKCKQRSDEKMDQCKYEYMRIISNGWYDGAVHNLIHGFKNRFDLDVSKKELFYILMANRHHKHPHMCKLRNL
jgi:hypothetical protein